MPSLVSPSPTFATGPSGGAPLRLGLVGCGKVGEVHRERLQAEPVTITAICDPDAEALSRMAGRISPRPRLFRTEQDMLAAGLVDAVILCTPHAKHAQQIRAALSAGAHILCEKPFVVRASEAEELVNQARERGLALFVSYTRRSRGHARFLQYAASRIGPLTHILVTRAQPWRDRYLHTWRMHSTDGGGFLLDAGASMIDLLLRLVDAPVLTTYADLVRGGGDADVDIRAFVRLTFSNGVRADLALIGDATETVERIELFGERGTAGWTMREDHPFDLYLRPDGGPSETGDPASFRTLLPDAAFVAALRSGRSFGADSAQDLYDAVTAIPVVELVEGIYRTATWR